MDLFKKEKADMIIRVIIHDTKTNIKDELVFPCNYDSKLDLDTHKIFDNAMLALHARKKTR